MYAAMIRKLFFGLLIVAPLLSFEVVAANTANGQQLYARNCALCHGARGLSTMASAPNFKRGEGLFQSDFDILRHIEQGKNACPAFIGIMREQQMLDVIAYMRTLYR